MNIEEIQPVRDLVLIKLPPYTDKLERGMGELSINTLNQIKYHPTYGEVVKASPDLLFSERYFAPKGSFVYFEKSHWQAAKDAAFDSESEVEKGIYFEQDVFAIHIDDNFYMMLPYRYLYMAKKWEWQYTEFKPNGKLGDLNVHGQDTTQVEITTMLNGYVLCEPVSKAKAFYPTTVEDMLDNGAARFKRQFEIADAHEETYALNQVKIIELPTQANWLAKDDIAFTLIHCDIPLVEGINNNNENQQFIIESDNIIAKYSKNMESYIAAPNRIVIEILETEKDENALKIDSDFAKMCKVKVVSAGEGVKCKEGDVIIIPRNAGKKNRLPLLDNKQYEVIGKDDYFVTVKESK